MKLNGVFRTTAIALAMAFSASGTITQNTNWDAYGTAFTSDPLTVGDLTFSGANLILGPGSVYNPARGLFLKNTGFGDVTVQVAGTHSLLGFNAGNMNPTEGPVTFTVTTNVGAYIFVDAVNIALNSGPLSFFGFEATSGEHFTSLSWSARDGTGVTDVQLGTAVPEPGTWAMLILGFAMIGYAARRHSRGVRSTIAAA